MEDVQTTHDYGTGGIGPRFDVAYTEPRNRLTVAFRLILAIPHLIVVGVWAYLAEILAVVQWFIILFTGKRNRGLFDMQLSWLSYAARVYAYVGLLYDPWPNIGPDQRDEPTEFTPPTYVEEANRLTSALRIIWIIPALIILYVLAIGVYVVSLIAWFAILFTGKHPRGMFDFVVRVHRTGLRTVSYGLLMHDEYPKYLGSEPTGQVGPAGGRPQFAGPTPGYPPQGPPPTPGSPLPPPTA